MRLFLLAILLWPLWVGAQDFPRDPATGKIVFAEEVPVMDGPQTDLYRRARAWLLANSQAPRDLLVDDAANGVLIARTFAWVRVRGKSKGPDLSYKLWHTIKIEVENDRFWYSFTNMKIQEAAASAPAKAGPPLALESILPTGAGAAKKRRPQPALAAQVHARVTNRIQDLKVSMR